MPLFDASPRPADTNLPEDTDYAIMVDRLVEDDILYVCASLFRGTRKKQPRLAQWRLRRATRIVAAQASMHSFRGLPRSEESYWTEV